MKHFVSLTKYAYGIALLVVFIILACIIFKDYGVSWDEKEQREIGYVTYNHVLKGENELFNSSDKSHGVAFELTLIFVEKALHLTDAWDVAYSRHLVTHLLFLLGCFCGYILIYRLFNNNVLACIGFLILVLMPRQFAHSFFNSKDLPFMSMMLISFALAQIAFEKQKLIWIMLLGMACGYTTGIRIMGIMLVCFISLFFIIDVVHSLIQKKKIVAIIKHCLVFWVSFCLTLYVVWPYLWQSPIHNFLQAFTSLSHFSIADGPVLFNGQIKISSKQPITYLPVWFLITTPVLWLIAGFSGIVFILMGLVQKPIQYFANTPQRNLLLYLLCFFCPIIMVIALHSILYDDWRHLYFIYPSFVLMGIFVLNKLAYGKYKRLVFAACIAQISYVGYFMVRNHPYQQVYFNALVSHKDQYLRKHYDLDYWGVSFKQGLQYLASTDTAATITICDQFIARVITDNFVMLKPKDRNRFRIVDYDNHPDYFVTNFRYHPDNYNFPKIVYEIKVLNSTILCIYKMK